MSEKKVGSLFEVAEVDKMSFPMTSVMHVIGDVLDNDANFIHLKITAASMMSNERSKEVINLGFRGLNDFEDFAKSLVDGLEQVKERLKNEYPSQPTSDSDTNGQSGTTKANEP